MGITLSQYEAMKARLAKHKPDAQVRREIPGKIITSRCAPPDIGWITIPGPCVPKPRMTQSDRWKKRPCVLRYREYGDRLRRIVQPSTFKVGAIAISLRFYIATKDAELWDTPHDKRPDLDNLCKSMDALFADDSHIWKISAEKYWCKPGDERTELRIV